MACGCNRRISAQRAAKQSKRRTRISLNVLNYRKDICSSCDFSTKRPKKQQAFNGVLGPSSKCLKSKRMLVKVLKDPSYSCPINKFPDVPPLDNS